MLEFARAHYAHMSPALRAYGFAWVVIGLAIMALVPLAQADLIPVDTTAQWRDRVVAYVDAYEGDGLTDGSSREFDAERTLAGIVRFREVEAVDPRFAEVVRVERLYDTNDNLVDEKLNFTNPTNWRSLLSLPVKATLIAGAVCLLGAALYFSGVSLGRLDGLAITAILAIPLILVGVGILMLIWAWRLMDDFGYLPYRDSSTGEIRFPGRSGSAS